MREKERKRASRLNAKWKRKPKQLSKKLVENLGGLQGHVAVSLTCGFGEKTEVDYSWNKTEGNLRKLGRNGNKVTWSLPTAYDRMQLR